MDRTLGGAFSSHTVEKKSANTKPDIEMIHIDQHTCSWWLPSKEHYYPMFRIWTSELTSVCVF